MSGKKVINEIIDDEWTPVDFEIKQMLLEYPDLYSDRNDCRIHLFATGGNGYRWNLETGEFECIQIENEKREIPDLEEITNEDNKFLRMRKERINLLRKFDYENIDLIVKDFYGGCYSSFKSKSITDIHGISWDDNEKHISFFNPMQIACVHKDKIADHWRHEIRDFCKWIIGKTRKFLYCPSQKETSTHEEIIEKLSTMKFRKGSEMRRTYETAVKVYNNILTDEEKQQEEEHRLAMVNMFDEILGDKNKNE